MGNSFFVTPRKWLGLGVITLPRKVISPPENSGAVHFVPSRVPPEIRKPFALNALRRVGTRLRIWFFTE
jgi:hypothetical protein